MKAWVRPGPPPLRKGLFDMEREETGSAVPKFIELYPDCLVYFDSPPDSRGGAMSLPEGTLLLRDVDDFSPLDDGFLVVCANTATVVFKGPKGALGAAELAGWIDALGDHWERERSRRSETPDDGGRGRGASENAPPELMAGPVGRRVEGSAVPAPYEAALTASEFRMWPAEFDDAATGSPCMTEVKDIKEVTMSPQGFTVETFGEQHFVAVSDVEELDEWGDAWDSALMDGFEKLSETHWRRREARVLHSCPMQLSMIGGDKGPQQVYGVAATDRLAIYKDALAAQAQTGAIIEIRPSELQKVHVNDEGVQLELMKGSMQLAIANSNGDLDLFYECLRICFSRRPCPTDEELKQTTAECRAAQHLKGLPASATVRGVAKTMVHIGEKERATCQGMQGIYHEGKLLMRYCVLFPDRLVGWDSVEDMLRDSAPQSGVKLDQISNIEYVDTGYILTTKEPAKKKKHGYFIGNAQELKIWRGKLQEAMGKRKELEQADTERRQRSRSPGPFPRKEKPGFVPRCAAFKTPGRRSLFSLGSFTQPRMLKQSRSFHLTKHIVPESHKPNKNGTRLNTSKDLVARPQVPRATNGVKHPVSPREKPKLPPAADVVKGKTGGKKTMLVEDSTEIISKVVIRHVLRCAAAKEAARTLEASRAARRSKVNTRGVEAEPHRRQMIIAWSVLFKKGEEFWKSMPKDMLLVFGAKRCWIFPKTAAEHEESRSQHATYTSKEAEGLRAVIIEKEKRGEVFWFKPDNFAISQDPLHGDPAAFPRFSEWIQRFKDPANGCRRYRPLHLDVTWWVSKFDTTSAKFEKEAASVIRTIGTGAHVGPPVMELLWQSNPTLEVVTS